MGRGSGGTQREGRVSDSTIEGPSSPGISALCILLYFPNSGRTWIRPFLQDMVEDDWILGLANLGDSQSVGSFLSPLLSNQRGAVFGSPGFL